MPLKTGELVGLCQRAQNFSPTLRLVVSAGFAKLQHHHEFVATQAGTVAFRTQAQRLATCFQHVSFSWPRFVGPEGQVDEQQGAITLWRNGQRLLQAIRSSRRLGSPSKGQNARFRIVLGRGP